MKKKLSDISLGAACRISAIGAEGLMRRRLMDLGFVPGTKVECLRRSPAGDPTAYLVRGTVIALRKEDASCVYIY
ncbi:MAG TPA: FeoA family protein [Negativicutes bacterium]|nr:FeoA family protein [Negativicutes bacterium]